MVQIPSVVYKAKGEGVRRVHKLSQQFFFFFFKLIDLFLKRM